MGDLDKSFHELTGYMPNDFQNAALNSSGSMLIIAPTGRGKTEALVAPFLLGRSPCARLIYVSPTRTLIDETFERIMGYSRKSYGEAANEFVTAHHGERPGTRYFDERILVTTVDQLLTTYYLLPVGIPLSASNIAAGSIAQSHIVFDEIHAYDPETVKSILWFIKNHVRHGMPVSIASATIPANLRDVLEQILGCKAIVSSLDRKGKVHLHKAKDDLRLSADEVTRRRNGRTTVVVNTVERAQALAKELRKRGQEVTLLHSRFLPDDRKRKERSLSDTHGKDGDGSRILVATQVIENGLNLSSDTMLTECAPADALVQRAGRIARFDGEEGDLYVYRPESPHPYDGPAGGLVDSAWDQIEDNKILSWDYAYQLVEAGMGRFYEDISRKTVEAKGSEILCAQERKSRRDLRHHIRATDSAYLIIHENLEPAAVERLPRLRVPVKTLRKNCGKPGTVPRIVEWEMDENLDRAVPVIKRATPDQIGDGTIVILSPSEVSYDQDIGLLFEPGGPSFDYGEPIKKRPPKYEYEDEPWIEHVRRTVGEVRSLLKSHERKLCAVPQEFDRWAALAASLHDVGKLDEDWQRAAGGSEGKPLAHFKNEQIDPPAHSTISAVAVWAGLKAHLPPGIVEAVVFSLAHHHTPWSHKVRPFRLLSTAGDLIDQAVAMTETGIEHLEIRESHETGTEIRPLPKDRDAYRDAYRYYVILSYYLRKADQEASKHVSREVGA